MVSVDCIVDTKCILAEGPVWSPQNQSLYWVDVGKPSKLYEWNAYTEEITKWEMGERATGLALRKHAGLVVVTEKSINLFDRITGKVKKACNPPEEMNYMRLNDCGCDSHGRLWTGTMLDNFNEELQEYRSRDSTLVGTIYRIDEDYSWHNMATNIGCPNTFVWSPNDRALYTADSITGWLYTYRYDPISGTISDRNNFSREERFGIPDGSDIDEEGYIWNARWGGGCVLRIDPNGKTVNKVDIPALLVTSCIFGGPDLDILYVTTARYGLSDSDLASRPLSGGIFAFKAEVPGRTPNLFYG